MKSFPGSWRARAVTERDDALDARRRQAGARAAMNVGRRQPAGSLARPRRA